jgi:hypothetical protein
VNVVVAKDVVVVVDRVVRLLLFDEGRERYRSKKSGCPLQERKVESVGAKRA